MTLVGFVVALTTPLVVSQGNLESVKEMLIRVSSTPQCSPIGFWARLVKLGHVVG